MNTTCENHELRNGNMQVLRGRPPKTMTLLHSQRVQVAVGLAHSVIRTYVGGSAKDGKHGGGGTLAHWQIGLAYAQYLSPELHMICNQIVKDFVDAKPETASSLYQLVRDLAHGQVSVGKAAWLRT